MHSGTCTRTYKTKEVVSHAKALADLSCQLISPSTFAPHITPIPVTEDVFLKCA